MSSLQFYDRAMSSRHRIVTLAVVVLMGLVAGPTAAGAAKKPKAPCVFKLARIKADHTRVRIRMTCHQKLVVNIRFTLKKYTVKTFKPFPGAQCGIQSRHVAGCIYGNGAPMNKTVTAIVGIDKRAPAHDTRFAVVQMFISGGHDMFEVLAY
jgi:hypothetical protein